MKNMLIVTKDKKQYMHVENRDGKIVWLLKEGADRAAVFSEAAALQMAKKFGEGVDIVEVEYMNINATVEDVH